MNIADLIVSKMILEDPTVSDITSALEAWRGNAAVFSDPVYPGPQALLDFYETELGHSGNLLDLAYEYWDAFSGFGADGLDTLAGDDLTTLSGTYLIML